MGGGTVRWWVHKKQQSRRWLVLTLSRLRTFPWRITVRFASVAHRHNGLPRVNMGVAS